ncbi:hypothetical protein ACIPL1_18090 [Pseudomonas sp. NPDC090202]|uniref:hypothetical protein n=1 Tax=unclassified Pseudomonas TaxID=196821 RepID=UPI0037F8D3D7
MHSQTQQTQSSPARQGAVKPEEEVEVDVDNDPGNEDPGSQFDRDATVPLINPDE